jgi:hypothetical protein
MKMMRWMIGVVHAEEEVINEESVGSREGEVESMLLRYTSTTMPTCRLLGL